MKEKTGDNGKAVVQPRYDPRRADGDHASTDTAVRKSVISLFYDVQSGFRSEDMSLTIRTTSFDSLTDPLRVFASSRFTVHADDNDYDHWQWLLQRDTEACKETESVMSSQPIVTWERKREGINSEEIGRLRNEFNQHVANGSYSRADRKKYLGTIRLIKDSTDDSLTLLRWSPKFDVATLFLYVIPINTLLVFGYIVNMIQRPFRRRRR